MKKLLPLFIAALLLAGCGEAEPEVTGTSPPETTADGRFLLTRGWMGEELLRSIFFCGEYRPLPFDPEDCPGLTLSGGALLMPDGSSAEAALDEDGMVIGLRFLRGSAPADFSVYGADLSVKSSELQSIVGIANSVIDGGEDGPLVYSYYEGGITELTFVFTEGALTEVVIIA